MLLVLINTPAGLNIIYIIRSYVAVPSLLLIAVVLYLTIRKYYRKLTNV